MASVSKSMATFVDQFQAMSSDFQKLVSESEVIKFVVKHENVLNHLSLALMDTYCLFYSSPGTFFASYLFTTVKPDTVEALASKLQSVWMEHPKSRPLIVGMGISATAISPTIAFSATCGTFTAQQLNTQPIVKSTQGRISNWFWSMTGYKTD